MSTGLVLASNSPRRKQLLTIGGWSFRLQAVEVDESLRQEETPQEYVLRLAQEKAAAAALRVNPGEIVLSADTAVVDAGCILGKPRSPQDAVHMLQKLRGHTHQVLTALAVLRSPDGSPVTEICASDVPMRNYTDAEIETYVASGDPMDKAGAYAIQNQAFHPVLAMSDCFASVMGLPLCHLRRALARLGIENPLDVPIKCQSGLGYICDYYPQVVDPLPVLRQN